MGIAGFNISGHTLIRKLFKQCQTEFQKVFDKLEKFAVDAKLFKEGQSSSAYAEKIK